MFEPAVLFSHNKSATSNQPTVLFSQNKPAPAINYQPNEQAVGLTMYYWLKYQRISTLLLGRNLD
jgi:hypothetical protein